MTRGATTAAFLLLAVAWSANFIFVHWAAEHVTPLQITLLRVVLGFLPILALGLAAGALRWRHALHLHHFVVMSLIATALYHLAFAKGTVLLLSSVAGMLSGAIPLFTFLAAWAFLRSEPLNARSAAGTLLGFLGILLITRPWAGPEAGAGEVSVAGVLWMLAGSLSLGASFVYARRSVSPLGLSPVALATYQMGLAALVLAAVTALGGIGAVFSDARAAVGLIVGLGLAGTGLAYVLHYLLVQRMGAVRASAVTYLPPVGALLIGLAAGEPVQALDLAAMAAILAGVWIVQGPGQQTRRRWGGWAHREGKGAPLHPNAHPSEQAPRAWTAPNSPVQLRTASGWGAWLDGWPVAGVRSGLSGCGDDDGLEHLAGLRAFLGSSLGDPTPLDPARGVLRAGPGDAGAAAARRARPQPHGRSAPRGRGRLDRNTGRIRATKGSGALLALTFPHDQHGRLPARRNAERSLSPAAFRLGDRHVPLKTAVALLVCPLKSGPP